MDIAENGPAPHTLIPLAEFKALLSVDDREDACYPQGSLSSFVLITATYTIEQYCGRRLLLKTHTDYLDYTGDSLIVLREYPVRGIESVHVDRDRRFGPESLLSPENYHAIPEIGLPEDIPAHLRLKPSPRLIRGELSIKTRYTAGYETAETPPDLKSACLELAAWNMARYRGRRIGIIGNVRGKGTDGEHLESSMPENVRQLLEPYKRRTI
jgi:uncharacterized phiE125 gp8 family phage protein